MNAIMLFDTALGEGISGVFNSPEIVPVFGTLMILGIVVASNWSATRRREMESQERLTAIAKGLPPPPTQEEIAMAQVKPGSSLTRQRNAMRLTGLVLASLGLGLGIFGLVLTWILGKREVLTVAASGLIFLVVGAGFLIDASLKTRELQRDSSPDPGPLH